MSFWIKAEVEKYRGKQVLYKGEICICKEVFWNDSDEEFIYYIDDRNNKRYKVFEEEITLVS